MLCGPALTCRRRILQFCTIIQTCREYKKDLYAIFIDFKKAFDSVNHSWLLYSLAINDFDEELVKRIEALYRSPKATFSTGINNSYTTFEVKSGIRQGDTLSPKLFILLLEIILKNAQHDLDDCFKNEESNLVKVMIDGTPTVSFKLEFADDIVIYTYDQKLTEKIAHVIEYHAKKTGLELNKDKTKMMATQYKKKVVSMDLNGDNNDFNKRAKATWRARFKNKELLNRADYKNKLKIYNCIIRPATLYSIESMRPTIMLTNKFVSLEKKVLHSIFKKEIHPAMCIKDIILDRMEKPRKSFDVYVEKDWKRPVDRPPKRLLSLVLDNSTIRKQPDREAKSSLNVNIYKCFEGQSQNSQEKISEKSEETVAFVHSDLDNSTFKSTLGDDSIFEDEEIRDYKDSVIMKSSFGNTFLPKLESSVVCKKEHINKRKMISPGQNLDNIAKLSDYENDGKTSVEANIPIIKKIKFEKNFVSNFNDIEKVINGDLLPSKVFDNHKLELEIRKEKVKSTKSMMSNFKNVKCNILDYQFEKEEYDLIVTSYGDVGNDINHVASCYIILSKNIIFTESIRFNNAMSPGLASLKGLTSLYNKLHKLIKDEIIPYNCKISYVPTDIGVSELISSKIKCKNFVDTTEGPIKAELLQFLQLELDLNVNYSIVKCDFLERVIKENLHRRGILMNSIGTACNETKSYSDFIKYFNK
uniref:Reverse transcriptase domain-containing protein n=1 Tax=Strongyloides papillosus TaxID=174720 RepID=A0A0N5C6I3_STREA